MKLKDKFHNFELAVVLKSKAAPIAQPLAAKAKIARPPGSGFGLIGASIFRDDLSGRAPLLQARFRRPILSDKPNSALVEQRP